MKEIGEFLKQKRLEKGLTIDQIVDKTRMPATRIKALEEGNIELFKDDLTYLQFFVKSYCKALDVDYDELKSKVSDSVNGYTTMFQAEQLRAISESEQHIREKSNKRIEEYKKINKPKHAKRNIDFSLISFVIVVCIILGCVVFVGGNYIKDKLNQPEPPIVDTPTDPVVPNDKPQIDQPEDPVVVKEIEVVPVEGDVTKFDILNATETFAIKIEFVPSSWFDLKFDGVKQSTPKPNIYDAGKVLEIEVDPNKVTEISLNFGYFWKMKVSVDDKEITFDESIAYRKGKQLITFTVKGE